MGEVNNLKKLTLNFHLHRSDYVLLLYSSQMVKYFSLT